MSARCKNVEDGAVDVCSDPTLKVDNKHNFWKCKEVMELNKDVVQSGMRMIFEGSQLRLAESVDTRRKNISVFNQVERLNKQPNLFIKCFRLLATSKGMAFNIDKGEPDEAITPKTKDARTNYKIESLLNAPDITNDEYDELSARKKQSKTTTEENF